MLKDLIKKFNLSDDENLEDDKAEELIEQHINNLAQEKDSLSKEKEELTTSVEGYKSSEENLTKELEQTKTELATTKGKLEQVTSMYKEQFTTSEEEDKPDLTNKKGSESSFDIIQALIGTR